MSVFALAISDNTISLTPSAPSPAQQTVIPLSKTEAHIVELNPRIPVDVLRVIDGDTIEVRAHVWLDQQITTKVRLRSIDAPELQARCAVEVEKANASRHQPCG